MKFFSLAIQRDSAILAPALALARDGGNWTNLNSTTYFKHRLKMVAALKFGHGHGHGQGQGQGQGMRLAPPETTVGDGVSTYLNGIRD